MALALKPKLLLLDEPTGGMSPEERRVTGKLLAADQGALRPDHRRARPAFHPRHLRSADGARPGQGAGPGRRRDHPALGQGPAGVHHPCLTQPSFEVDGLCAGYGRSQALVRRLAQGARTAARSPCWAATAPASRRCLKTLFGELPPMSRHASASTAPRSKASRPSSRVRRGIGYVPQEHAIFAKLTVRENLLLGCVRQPDRSGMDYVLDFFPKLAQRLGQTAGTLSGGERKMLAIGRAVLGRPKLLMLDEPTEGVWVGVIEEIADRLKQLSREMARDPGRAAYRARARGGANMPMSWTAGTSRSKVPPPSVKSDPRADAPPGAVNARHRPTEGGDHGRSSPDRRAVARSRGRCRPVADRRRREVLHRADAAERGGLQRRRCHARQPAAGEISAHAGLSPDRRREQAQCLVRQDHGRRRRRAASSRARPSC